MADDLAGNQGGQVEGQAGSAATAPVAPDFGTFRQTLGDLGKEKSLDVVKDWGGLVKSYVESQKMIGNSIRLPGPDAKPEDWKKVYQRLGAPESPDKYQIAVPKEVGWDEESLGAYRHLAHDLGLTQTQAAKMVEFLGEREQNKTLEYTKTLGEGLKGLQQEWGANYPRKMAFAKRAIQDPAVWQALNFKREDAAALFNLFDGPVSGKLGDHPVMIKFFSALGEMMAEDGIISSEVSGMAGPSGAEEEIKKIMGDPKHALWNASDPGHKDAVEKWTKLHELAGGRI